MNSILKMLALCIVIPGAVALSLAGCEKDGPIENAGEKIDNTLGTDDTKSEGPFEKAGESVDEATDGK